MTTVFRSGNDIPIEVSQEERIDALFKDDQFRNLSRFDKLPSTDVVPPLSFPYANTDTIEHLIGRLKDNGHCAI